MNIKNKINVTNPAYLHLVSARQMNQFAVIDCRIQKTNAHIESPRLKNNYTI